MNNSNNLSSADIRMIGLVDRYLKVKSDNEYNEAHLNEDTLTAFVEGGLNKRESKYVVNHLVGCSFCRHITAELVKLEMAFAEETTPEVEYKNEPTKVSEVLSGILSRLFGTSEGAVFAHEEKQDNEDEDNSVDTE